MLTTYRWIQPLFLLSDLICSQGDLSIWIQIGPVQRKLQLVMWERLNIMGLVFFHCLIQCCTWTFLASTSGHGLQEKSLNIEMEKSRCISSDGCAAEQAITCPIFKDESKKLFSNAFIKMLLAYKKHFWEKLGELL